MNCNNNLKNNRGCVGRVQHPDRGVGGGEGPGFLVRFDDARSDIQLICTD
jgi:hypothetical protein